ncbi:MAG: M48 family metallopeptidase [Clostridia bacterium]|nr:M48 family metallopeptidase [Clostridia bacterium]
MNNSENVFFIDGIKVTSKRSKGRRVRIKVDGSTAEVLLFVPRGASEAVARKFAASKAGWIKSAVERAAKRIEASRPKDGAIRLFGSKVNFTVRRGGRSFFDGQAVFLTVKGEGEESFNKALTEFYREELRAYIESVLPDFVRKTGLIPSEWRLRDMKTRWGSCAVKTKKLTFNVKLAMYPKECADYVILHELAHLKYADHGRNFKALLTAYMPDWKLRKNLLNGE